MFRKIRCLLKGHMWEYSGKMIGHYSGYKCAYCGKYIVR